MEIIDVYALTAGELEQLEERINEDLRDTATRRLELLSRAMNALEGWRILLDMPITEIMWDIEKELKDE